MALQVDMLMRVGISIDRASINHIILCARFIVCWHATEKDSILKFILDKYLFPVGAISQIKLFIGGSCS